MKKLRLLVVFSILIINVIAQSEKRNKIDGRLKLSKDRRSFVYQDEKPFFWLGDTGWEIFHRLTKEEAELYFRTRSAQGFTVIQAVALAELDGLHVPNAYGQLPLKSDDPAKPLQPYFDHVEWVIDKAADYGLYIGLLPTWGDKLYKDKWGKGPEIFNVDNAKPYGKWIGERFKNKANVIWILGGDRNPRNEADVAVWRAMASGLTEELGESNALISYHPQPSQSSSSSTWFHQESWLDFNMLQTGHCRDIPVWSKIDHDYKLQPAKPVLNGEPIYEDHPVCFNAKELGFSNAYDVRKAAYLSIFAGSAGITYGCHAVWQFYAPPRQGVNSPVKPWQASLELPAATQMRHLKRLMARFPATTHRPAQEILSDTLDGTKRIQAISGDDHVLIYSAGGEAFRFESKAMNTVVFKSGYWYDPRNGNQQRISQSVIKSKTAFNPPTKGDGNDWVLVLMR